jgi:hypothetical protein
MRWICPGASDFPRNMDWFCTPLVQSAEYQCVSGDTYSTIAETCSSINIANRFVFYQTNSMTLTSIYSISLNLGQGYNFFTENQDFGLDYLLKPGDLIQISSAAGGAQIAVDMSGSAPLSDYSYAFNLISPIGPNWRFYIRAIVSPSKKVIIWAFFINFNHKFFQKIKN